MPYGYLGTTPNLQLNNSGVFSVEEALSLQKVGELGGSLELIQTQTVDDSDFSEEIGFVDFTNLGNYDVHFLTYKNLFLQGYGCPALRFYESGVLETASVYSYAYQEGISSGTFAEGKSTGDDFLRLGKSAYQNINGYAYLYKLLDSSKYSFVTSQSSMVEGNNLGSQMSFGGGTLPQSSAVDGIRFISDPMQWIGSLEISLYGVKQ